MKPILIILIWALENITYIKSIIIQYVLEQRLHLSVKKIYQLNMEWEWKTKWKETMIREQLNV